VTEFHEFLGHPLADDLDRRVTHILRCMALLRYRTFSLYRAQLAITRDLLALEESLRNCRSESSALRARATRLAVEAIQTAQALTEDQKQQVKSLQQQADDYALAVRLLRYGRWVYRYLADGIAWRAYGYNREAIRALGGKEPVPFLSKKEGIDKELNLFRAIRRQGRGWLPLMHDLTNCIRTADFSIFKDGRLYRIIELKIRQSQQTPHVAQLQLRPGAPREYRQQERLQKIFEFFETGDLGKLSPELAGGRSIRSAVLERHNYDAVSTAMKQARSRGFGFEQPERGILYIAWDGRKNPVDEAISQASKAWPDVFDSLFTFRSISPRYEQYHDMLPITAMDLPVRDVSDLLFGRIGLACMVNFGCVEQYCRENGVPIAFQRGESGRTKITVGSRPPFGEVREGLWDRLLLEALCLASFTGLVKAIMAEYHLR
jgi:hypothetical protein